MASKGGKIQKTKYSFPILEPQQILDILSELQINFTVEHYENLSSQAVRAVWLGFMERLVGMREEDFVPAPAVMDTLSFPQIHEEGLGEMFFFHMIRMVMEYAQMPNFALCDITTPDKKRFQYFVSGLVNFLRFQTEQLAFMNQYVQDAEDKKDFLKQVVDNADDLQTRLNALLDAREREKQQTEVVKGEIQTIQNDLRMVFTENENMKKHGMELKMQFNALDDKINTVNIDIGTAQQEVHKFSSQIVQSPDRMKRQLESLIIKNESERAALMEVEQRLRDGQARLEGIVRSEKDVTACIKLLHEIEAEIEKCRVLSKENKALGTVLSEHDARSREFQSQEQVLKRQIKGAEEKLFRQQKQQDLRRDAAVAALADSRKTCIAMEKDRQIADAQIAENNLKAKQMRMRLEQATKQHEIEMNQLRTQKTALVQAVGDYQMRLNAAIAAQ